MCFDKLTAYLDSLDEVCIYSRDLMIYRDHEPIYRHFSGHNDHARITPMNGNETYWLFSCTKVITTCAAMQLVEQGKLQLDAPVSDYLPAYAHLNVLDGDTVCPARAVMTIRHLMSMQAGLDYDLQAPALQEVVKAHPQGATTRQIADAIALKPLAFEPGTRFGYSLCHDVLAAVVEVISGQRFADYVQDHIIAPLGLPTMTFILNPALQARMCAKYWYNHEEKTALPAKDDAWMPFILSPNHDSGGAGIISDVQDYALFADALACGGVGKTGARLLRPETIDLWRQDQLCPQAKKDFEWWGKPGYSYALGVRTRISLETGGAGALGEFGWDGAAGAWMFADPKNHLSAFLAENVQYNALSGSVHSTIRSMIYEALELA